MIFEDNYITGVEEKTLRMLRNGEYDKVLAKPAYVEHITAEKSGFVEEVNALALGKATVVLGGGRLRPGDKIEPAVGIKLIRTKGDQVQKGDVLAEVHHNGKLTATLKTRIEEAFLIGQRKIPIDRILAIIKAGAPTMEYEVYRSQY